MTDSHLERRTNRAERPSDGKVALAISIDTEEDNWNPTVDGVTVRNIDELPALDAFLGSLGVRPTYFVTYQVAANAGSAAIIRQLNESGRTEIAAHLHPWNTPPSFGIERRISMLRDYPPEVQRQKLEALLQAFDEHLGVTPTSFRAGRFGVGRATIEALIAKRIFVDSSVTPLLSWEGQGGPSFIEAPTQLYRLDGSDNVRVPTESGSVIEVPVTVGFTRFAPSSWPRIAELFASPQARMFHLPGLASRSGLVRRVILTPETHSAEEMLNVSRRCMASGAPFLHLYLHSSSLLPGLTPFTQTQHEVDRMVEEIRRYVDGLNELADVAFCTVTEAAGEFGPPDGRPAEGAG